MHFIPSPNNTEFLYLVGLENSVDRLLQGNKVVPPEPQPTPFICSQCGTDFTPAWKWEAQPLISEGNLHADTQLMDINFKILQSKYFNDKFSTYNI